MADSTQFDKAVFPKCGHPRSPENSYPKRNRSGSFSMLCRECLLETKRRSWRKMQGPAKTFEEKFFDPETIAGRYRRAVLDCFIEKHKNLGLVPTSGRFLFYELEHTGLFDKKKDTDALDRVSNALTDLREHGYIAWEDIIDETRSVTENSHHPTIRESIESSLQYATISLWHPEPQPLVITESRSLRGVIDDLCDEYQLNLTSVNGHCAGHLRTKVAEVIRTGQVVLYLGDHDFGGHVIEANTHAVLQEITGSELAWERVAITEAQIEEHSLTPILKTDGRSNKTYAAVETEALGQGLIVKLLRDRLEQLMPAYRIEAVRAREASERRRLLKQLAVLKGKGRR
jgi:hypothetical protein